MLYNCGITKRDISNQCVVFATGCENDCQIDGIAKLAPVVAFYAGKPDMLEKVEQATRVTQNNDGCVAETLAAARSVCFSNTLIHSNFNVFTLLIHWRL